MVGKTLKLQALIADRNRMIRNSRVHSEFEAKKNTQNTGSETDKEQK